MANIIDAKTAISTAGIESGAAIIKEQYTSAVKVVKDQFAQWIQAQRELDQVIANGGRNLQGQFASMAALRTNVAATAASLKAAATESALAQKELQTLGEAGAKSGFNLRYAFFGIKDIMEGRVRFAVAEAANELVRMGPIALAAGAAVAAIGGAGYGIYELAKRVREAAEEARAAAVPFKELELSIKTSNDEMIVANDRLANEISKLEGKHVNSLAIELDQAVVGADKLSESLAKDLTALTKLLDKQGVGGLKGFFTHQSSTTDIQKQVNDFSATVAEHTEEGRKALQAATTAKEKDAAQTALNALVTNDYALAIKKLNSELKTTVQSETATSPNTVKRVAEINGAIADLAEQQRSIHAREAQAAQQAVKDKLDADRETAAADKKATAEALAALKQKEADALEDLRDQGATLAAQQVLIKQEIAVDQAYPEHLRELNRELRTLRSEQSRQAVEAIKKDAAAVEKQAEQHREELSRWAKYFQELDDMQVAQAAKETENAVRIAEIRSKGATEMAESATKGAGDTQALALAEKKAQLEQAYGAQVEHTLTQQLQYMKQIAAIEEQEREAKIKGLVAEEAIAKAALDTANAKLVGHEHDEQGVKAAEDQVAAMKKIAELQQQINVLTQQNVTAGVQAQTKALQVQEQQYAKFFQQINTGFTHAFDSMITGQKNWEAQFGQIVNKMELDFINKLLLMTLKWAEQHLVMTAVHATATAQQVAITATGAAATQAINAATLLKEINIMAAKAAMGAYDAIVGIPIVGPILAPIAATTAGLAVEALGLVALETGTNYVPRTAPYMLHQGEAVVPKQFNPAASGGGAGGSNHITFNGGIHVSGGGPRQQATDFTSSLKTHLRRMNLVPAR